MINGAREIFSIKDRLFTKIIQEAICAIYSMHVCHLKQSKSHYKHSPIDNFTSQQKLWGIVLVSDEEHVSGKRGQSPVLKGSFGIT